MRQELAEVALIDMPFGDYQSPNLAISLLKSSLTNKSIKCDNHYLSLLFADFIGRTQYSVIYNLCNVEGDWFFAPSLFGSGWAQDFCFTKNEEINAHGYRISTKIFVAEYLSTRQRVEEYFDKCMSAVSWDQYKIIGFSTTFQQTFASLVMARKIKNKWPEKIIVFGGGNCDGEMGLELHRQFPFIDYICRGEGEIIFSSLVETILENHTFPMINGLVYREENGESVAIGHSAPRIEDLDQLSFPDFDDFFKQNNLSNADILKIFLPFQSSRGCWWGEKNQCRFCGLNGSSLEYRSKSSYRIVDELNSIKPKIWGR